MSYKCINHKCPIKDNCYIYTQNTTSDTKEIHYNFFYINGNHIGCEQFKSNRKMWFN